MTIPQVTQLRFARKKWLEGLDGLSAEDGESRIQPMNSISWMVGHLAQHEQFCWQEAVRGDVQYPQLQQFRSGQPASTPNLTEVMTMWQHVVDTSENHLDQLTVADLRIIPKIDGKPYREPLGSMFNRLIYHYWYHLGEMQAVRQLLGHTGLPGFVGRMDSAFWYAPENP